MLFYTVLLLQRVHSSNYTGGGGFLHTKGSYRSEAPHGATTLFWGRRKTSINVTSSPYNNNNNNNNQRRVRSWTCNHTFRRQKRPNSTYWNADVESRPDETQPTSAYPVMKRLSLDKTWVFSWPVNAASFVYRCTSVTKRPTTTLFHQ